MFAGNLSGLAALAVAMLASTAALASFRRWSRSVLTDMNGPASTPTGPGRSHRANGDRRFRGKGAGQANQHHRWRPPARPDIGGGIARRWYDVDQVDLIVDVPVSASLVQNIANERRSCSSRIDLGRGFPRKVLLALRDAVGDRYPFARGRHRASRGETRRRQLVLHYRRLCVRPRARTRRFSVSPKWRQGAGSVRPPLATPDHRPRAAAQASKAKIIGTPVRPTT